MCLAELAEPARTIRHSICLATPPGVCVLIRADVVAGVAHLKPKTVMVTAASCGILKLFVGDRTLSSHGDVRIGARKGGLRRMLVLC
jgi:hypothetical protein